MSENLKLSVGLQINDQEVDQSFRKLQDKLKNLQKATSTEMSPSATSAQSGQSRALQDMQKRYVEELNRQYAGVQKTMQGIEKLYESSLQSDKARIAAQEKLLSLKIKEKEITETLAKAGKLPPGQQPPAPPTTPGQPPQDPNSMFQGLFKNLLTTASVAAIIKGALNISQNLITAESREVMAEAGGMQSAARPLRELYQGRGVESAFFGQERLKALETASKQKDRQEILDIAKIAGSVVVGAVGGGIGGAAKGGIAGLALGGLGAIPAGIIGGGLGAVAGGIGAFGLSMTNDRNMSALFDRDRYEKMMTAEGMRNFEALEAAERAKNPFKSMAFDFGMRQQDNLLNLQRSTGLTDQTMFGMLQQNMGYGGGAYSLQEIMRNQSAMQQAGATSADLRGDLSGLAASARQYGVSGAGGILGRISAAGNQQESTDEAFIRIMATAVKNGVDMSSMPQELNRFATIAGEIATAGGGFSQSAMERFGAGVTDMSAMSMQGARGFAEDFSGRAGAFGGLEGQMGMGFLLGDEAKGILGEEGAKNLSSKGLASVINTLTIDELEKNPSLLKGYSLQLGVSEGKLKELVKKKDLAKNTRTEQELQALERLGQGIGTKQGQELEDYLASDEGATTMSEAFTQLRYSRGGGFRPDAQGRAAVVGLARMQAGTDMGITDADQSLARTAIRAPKEGVLEDVQRSRAVGDQAQVENLKSFYSSIGEAARSVDAERAKLEAALSAFTEAMKTGGDAMGQYAAMIKEGLDKMSSSTPVMPNRVQPRTSGAGGQ